MWSRSVRGAEGQPRIVIASSEQVDYNEKLALGIGGSAGVIVQCGVSVATAGSHCNSDYCCSADIDSQGRQTKHRRHAGGQERQH